MYKINVDFHFSTEWAFPFLDYEESYFICRSRVASSPPAARSSQATVTSSSSDSVYRQSIDDLDNELLALAADEGDVIDINDVSASDAPGNDTLLLDLEELIS